MKISSNNELINAINCRDLALVKAALESGENIEAPDQHGCPGLPLRRACFLGYQEIVVELLQRGANPNAANADGPGASMRMAQRGGHATICTLLQQYVIFNQTKETAKSPLIQADHHDLFGENLSSPEKQVPSLEETTNKIDAGQSVDVLLEFNIAPELPKPCDETITEILEIEACYGVDTQVLLEDVARIMSTEQTVQNTPPTHSAKADGFWQRMKK